MNRQYQMSLLQNYSLSAIEAPPKVAQLNISYVVQSKKPLPDLVDSIQCAWSRCRHLRCVELIAHTKIYDGSNEHLFALDEEIMNRQSEILRDFSGCLGNNRAVNLPLKCIQDFTRSLHCFCIHGNDHFFTSIQCICGPGSRMSYISIWKQVSDASSMNLSGHSDERLNFSRSLPQKVVPLGSNLSLSCSRLPKQQDRTSASDGPGDDSRYHRLVSIKPEIKAIYSSVLGLIVKYSLDEGGIAQSWLSGNPGKPEEQHEDRDQKGGEAPVHALAFGLKPGPNASPLSPADALDIGAAA